VTERKCLERKGVANAMGATRTEPEHSFVEPVARFRRVYQCDASFCDLSIPRVVNKEPGAAGAVGFFEVRAAAGGPRLPPLLLVPPRECRHRLLWFFVN
jgi:hypothetical protein